MTPTELRELDAWIHGNVMGLTLDPALGRFNCAGKYVPGDCPRYSTDIAAAWEVVEKMRERRESVFEMARPVGSGYLCNFIFNGTKEFGDTAPLAICLAAKKAFESKI